MQAAMVRSMYTRVKVFHVLANEMIDLAVLLYCPGKPGRVLECASALEISYHQSACNPLSLPHL